MYFQRIICCGCLGFTRYRFESPKSRMANKNSSNRNTRGWYYVKLTLWKNVPHCVILLIGIYSTCIVENKSQWKRSTMETQIQQAPTTSMRERHPAVQEFNHTAVECIMERPMDDNSSPICLSFQNSVGKRDCLKIKYISCDEDNNPIEHKHSHQTGNHAYNHSRSSSHDLSHALSHSASAIQKLWCDDSEITERFLFTPIIRKGITLWKLINEFEVVKCKVKQYKRN